MEFDSSQTSTRRPIDGVGVSALAPNAIRPPLPIAMDHAGIISALDALADRLAEPVMARDGRRGSIVEVHGASDSPTGFGARANSNKGLDVIAAHDPVRDAVSRTDSTGLHADVNPDLYIELILIGGAAGLLSGALAPDRTTNDCDVALYRPLAARQLVESAAAAVAFDLGLSPTWLNPGGLPWTDSLPHGWEARRVTVFRRDPLVVHAVGRLDLLLLKLLAGRPQDIEDLEILAITVPEAALLDEHLKTIPARGWPAGAVAEAIELIQILVGSTPNHTDPIGGDK